MAGFRQAVAATIFGFACALRWMHAQFVKPLGTSMDVAFPIVEETVKVRASNDRAAGCGPVAAAACNVRKLAAGTRPDTQSQGAVKL
jgi:hypothetical protein